MGFRWNCFIWCTSSCYGFQVWMAQHGTRFQTSHRVIQQQQQELNQTLVQVSNGKSFIRNDGGKGRESQRREPRLSRRWDLVIAHPWCISFDSEQVLLLLLLLLLLCCTANLSAQRTFVCSIVCVISISHRTEIVVHVPNNNNRPRLLKNKRLLSKVHFCCYSLCINRKMFTAENEKYKKKALFGRI